MKRYSSFKDFDQEKQFSKVCPVWGSNSRPSDFWFRLWDWRAAYCANEATAELFLSMVFISETYLQLQLWMAIKATFLAWNFDCEVKILPSILLGCVVIYILVILTLTSCSRAWFVDACEEKTWSKYVVFNGEPVINNGNLTEWSPICIGIQMISSGIWNK